MPNRLAGTTSPYLRQHQDNPVDWYPWNEAALSKAQDENKPIFLSIGYSACHWCHVMAHESFEDPAIAKLLNDHFVSIKVDREERPDLDDVYMQAVLMLTGQGGWPMSVFLTPDLEPFYGGTYFPPEPRYGMPSFKQILLSVIHSWDQDRGNIQAGADRVTDALRKHFSVEKEPQESFDFEAIVSSLYETYDWQYGGWGSAPKFPPAMLAEFLIQRAWKGDPRSKEIVEHLLERMAQGGMYDLVGGGFHRYSVDRQWLVPHFEKMLYDNALLAKAYLHGFAVTENPRFRQVAIETLEFIQNELTSPEGGFYASLDADTPEGEGRFYALDYKTLQERLSASDFGLLQSLTTLQPQGNFEDGLNILKFRESFQNLSIEQGTTIPDLMSEIGPVINKLKSIRDGRQAPGRDTKVILAWNALAIQAFISAGLLLARKDFLRTAEQAINFILGEMVDATGKLFRIWHEGKRNQPGTLSDYTGLILALHAQYEVDFSPETYQHMCTLYTQFRERFAPDNDFYFDSDEGTEDLLVRPVTLQDNAVPSGNALAAHVHWLFWNYENQNDDRKALDAMLAAIAPQANQYPMHFGYWLQIADLNTQKVSQIALAAEADLDPLAPFLEIYHRHYLPYSLIAARTMPDQAGAYPNLLDNKKPVDRQPTAYICRDFTCRQPITDPELLLSSILGSS